MASPSCRSGVLLAISLSGCWTQIGHNAGNTRYNDLERVLTRDNVASLSVDWSIAADPPGGGGGNLSEPVVFGDRVYTTNVRSGGGDRPVVQSYDLRSGRLAWEQPLPPDEASDEVQLRMGGARSAVLVDDVLWVPYWLEGPAVRCSGRLVGLDRATGEVLAAEETDRIESPLVADGSIVAYTARTGCGAPTQLVVRDRDSMETRWTYPVPSRTPFTATPTIAHGKIFVVFGGVLYAFDADGCSRDESEKQVCDPEWIREGAFRDRPVAGPAGQVLAVRESFGDEGTNQSVQALDSETGDLRWQTVGAYGEEGIAGIAVADDTVYVAGTSSTPSCR